ncbi:MAG: hypothetical protein AAGJ18_13150 [Bacteroidota bacterium]
MKERKNINQLFEAARTEKPQRSFEEVAQRFEVSLPTVSTLSKIKAFLFNLNNLLIMSVISLVAIFSFSLFTQENTPEVVKTPISETITTAERSAEPIIEVAPRSVENKIIEVPKSIIATSKPTRIEDRNTIKTKVSTSIKKEKIYLEERQVAQKIVSDEEQFQPKEKVVWSVPIPKIKDSVISTNTIAATNSASPIQLPIEIQPKKASTEIAKKSVTLQLAKSDSRKAVSDFAKTLNSYGIQTTVSQQKRGVGHIHKLAFQFRHAAGLDWRMKLQGFDLLEMKMLLDEQQRPYGLTYRLNQDGEFVDYLTLKHRSRSVHKFAKERTRSRHQHTRSLTRE